MFIIRRAKPDDVQTLLKLAKMVHFLNLPADREIIDAKVAWSRQCFLMAGEMGAHVEARSATAKRGKNAKATAKISSNGTAAATPAPNAQRSSDQGVLGAGLKSIAGRSPVFMFVMDEANTSDDRSRAGSSASNGSASSGSHGGSGGGSGSGGGGGSGGGVIGTSQIISQISSPGQPNLSLELKRVEKFSESLQVGVSHMVAKLHLDETGPTEIGGLILQPSYRGHREKLGRFLSMVRFHFMGLHRELFSPRVLAEMMGPVTIDGQTPFWDGFTRRFINMSYEEADKFCQESKEFILSLFPREELYLTLIPPDARACVAQVGEETAPARKMLERLGFKYHNRIDPFDGGPHLECMLDQITLVNQTKCQRLAGPVKDESSKALTHFGIVSVIDEDGEFRAAHGRFGLDRAGRVILPRATMLGLSAESGMEAGYTVLSSEVGGKAGKGTKKKGARGRT